MGGDTDLMDNAGDHGLDAGFVRAAGRAHPETLPSPDLLQTLHQRGHVAGLQHQIPNAQVGCRCGHILRYKRRCSQRHRAALHAGDRFQYADSVLLAEHQIQHQHIRLPVQNLPDGLFPIICRPNYLKTIGTLQRGDQSGAEIFGAVRDKNGCCVFHTFLSCQQDFSPCAPL